MKLKHWREEMLLPVGMNMELEYIFSFVAQGVDPWRFKLINCTAGAASGSTSNELLYECDLLLISYVLKIAFYFIYFYVSTTFL